MNAVITPRGATGPSSRALGVAGGALSLAEVGVRGRKDLMERAGPMPAAPGVYVSDPSDPDAMP